MKWFHNLKTAYKLAFLIVIALLSSAVLSATGYYYLLKANTDITSMYKDKLVPVQLINEACTYARASQSDMLELIITNDNNRKKELKIDLDRLSDKFSNNLAEYEQTKLDPFELETIPKVKNSMQKYRQERDRVVQLAIEDKDADAYTLFEQRVRPPMEEFQQYLTQLAEYNVKTAKSIDTQNDLDFEHSRNVLLSIVFIIFLLLIVSGLYIAQTITKPLSSMVEICKELSLGDFREKERVFSGKDEIAQLADELVSMRTSLRNLMKNVHESAEQLAAASEELTASADQSAQASVQVANSIAEVAKGSEQQLAATNHTTSVFQGLSTGIHQVAANANKAALQSSTVSDKAKEGNFEVNKAVEQMTRIEKTVIASAGLVSKLGDRSKEIGNIVDTIASIAGQTNLLALNAAIEAARAGEQGRGFAVVAEEVRKLAEQSQAAAKQIAELIGEIQNDTEKAVVSMNNGTHEVELGADIVNHSGNSFLEIVNLVTDISKQVQEISGEMDQMATNSQQIVGSVEKIDKLSKLAAEESQSVSAATEEQSASMEQISSSSQDLSRLAQDLQLSVNKFQL